MIESISIANAASYGSTLQVMDGLSEFNYVFGPNGSGKTTISMVIDDEEAFSDCMVKWHRGAKLETLVYNRGFIDRNFNQSSELKGVFTLGKKSVESRKKIEEAREVCDRLENTIRQLNSSSEGEDGTGGKKGELETLEEELQKKCWVQK